MTDHICDIERDLFDLISAVARMTCARFDYWARSHHLTRAQCITLKRLRDQPGACQNEVACLHEMEPMTISRQLDKLELLGLIERRHDVNDRRLRRLYMLPKGDKLLTLIENYRDQLSDFLIDDLSASECEALAWALLHMKNKIVDATVSGRLTRISRIS